jgi:hypothetical protein
MEIAVPTGNMTGKQKPGIIIHFSTPAGSKHFKSCSSKRDLQDHALLVKLGFQDSGWMLPLICLPKRTGRIWGRSSRDLQEFQGVCRNPKTDAVLLAEVDLEPENIRISLEMRIKCICSLIST